MFLTISKKSVVWLCVILVFSACQTSGYKKQSVSANYYLIDSLVAIDSLMDDEIKPYRDSLTLEMSKVIGEAERELSGGLPEGILTNFVSDLMLEECKVSVNLSQKPDVSLINVKGLRIPLQKGNITIGNIYQLMPFENEIVYLTLTKGQIIELFNYLASVGGDGIAGASFGMRDKQAVNIKVGGKALEERNYIIATSDYLADGGDHFVVFKSAIAREGTGLKVRDAIIQHIQRLTDSNKTINSQLDNRIYHAE